MADYDVVLIDPTDVIMELGAFDFPEVELIEPQSLIYELDTTGAQQEVINRVWDSVAGDYVRWSTNAIDSDGDSYPGPGTFGVDTSDFTVETVQYARL